MNPNEPPKGRRAKPFEPSPKDIRRECERIQGTWSQRERDKRAGRLSTATWIPPTINSSLLTDAGQEDQGDLPTRNGGSNESW